MSKLGSQQVTYDEDNYQQQISNQLINKIKTQFKRSLLIAIILLICVSMFTLYYYFSTADLVKDGIFFRQQILSKQMLPFWKQLKQQQENKNNTGIIQQGQHQITRQQLGHMGWTILHMVTGSFPQDIPQNLVKKWNTFMILFAQFYPCKICSGHFLQLLKDTQPFTGNKKEQLMKYLCQIHNKVNKRLGHPTHNCSKVKQQWNTCGCKG